MAVARGWESGTQCTDYVMYPRVLARIQAVRRLDQAAIPNEEWIFGGSTVTREPGNRRAISNKLQLEFTNIDTMCDRGRALICRRAARLHRSEWTRPGAQHEWITPRAQQAVPCLNGDYGDQLLEGCANITTRRCGTPHVECTIKETMQAAVAPTPAMHTTGRFFPRLSHAPSDPELRAPPKTAHRRKNTRRMVDKAW